MIVNRRTFNLKPGCADKAVEMLAAESAAEEKRSGVSRTVRIYSYNIGQFNQVAFEVEYKDLAEYDQFWAEWAARPTSAEWLKKWIELEASAGINEIWTLAE
jgi:hypothetical protein